MAGKAIADKHTKIDKDGSHSLQYIKIFQSQNSLMYEVSSQRQSIFLPIFTHARKVVKRSPYA